jgi:hypothetical protein
LDPFILRYNERVKSLAGVITNLGAALFAVAVARLADKGDAVGLIWIVGSLVLYWVGHMILGQLMGEG